MKRVKGTTRLAMRPTSSLCSHALPEIYPCLASVAKKKRHLINIFFGRTVVMFARLLVRWPRSSPVALHARARTFHATSLSCASSTALALKPRLPETSAHEPPADECTNRAHFSSTKFADAPISNRSKTAIPHEYVSLLSSFSAHDCRYANSIPGT